MKKFIIPFSVLSVFALLFGGITGSTLKTHIAPLAAPSLNCTPSPAGVPITDEEFQARYAPSAVMIRKNVYSLTTTEISAIKTGITNMKALGYTNKTSWLYQAAIHGTTLPDNLPSWNTCHQSGASFFFLAWHRMYLYFFERILRAKSGNPNLTLPYWNYQTNAVIPSAYRSNTAGNPLYDNTRSATLNAGGSLPTSILTSLANALNNNTEYYAFQTAINGPHGSVHTTIGGNMFSTSSAAKDPVFWLHHCNIDRIWEEWLRKCEGRANPGDNAWKGKTYTFFDENGTAVTMSGSQVMATASQLGYRYDFPFKLPCDLKIFPWKYVRKIELIKLPDPIRIESKLQRISLEKGSNDSLSLFIKNTSRTSFKFSRGNTEEKLIINLGNIKIDKMPQGVIEVYLNLPAGTAADPRGKNFVGVLDLFSIEHHQNHLKRAMDHNEDLELDATNVAISLGLTPQALSRAQLTFVLRGNSLRGREVPAEGKLTIGRTAFTLFTADKR